MQNKAEFEKSVMKTIDIRLNQIFGETGTSVIYNYLQTSLSLPHEEIPEKLEVFAEGLDRFLSSGAKVVEKVILDSLYSDFGREFQFKEGYNFADYVDELKRTARKQRK
jgi:hypothetical protein